MTRAFEDGVVVEHDGSRQTISSRTVIWTGGVRPAPIIGECGVETDKAGRALTAATMQTSREGVYAIGDCATVQNNVADNIISFLRGLAFKHGKDHGKTRRIPPDDRAARRAKR